VDKLSWLYEEIKQCTKPELALSTQKGYIRARLMDPMVVFLSSVDDGELTLSIVSDADLLFLLYSAKRMAAIIGFYSPNWCYMYETGDRIQTELMIRNINTYRGLAAFLAYDVKGHEEVLSVTPNIDDLENSMREYGKEDICWSVTASDELTRITTIYAGKGVVPKHVLDAPIMGPIDYYHSDIATLH